MTEEIFLNMFDGDDDKANAYLIASKDSWEETMKEFGPDGPVVKAIQKNLEKEFAWDDLVWWKKLLINFLINFNCSRKQIQTIIKNATSK